MVRAACVVPVSLLLPPCAGNTIGVQASCKYHIKDQTVTANAPSILNFDIEGDCPFTEFGMNQVCLCEECKAQKDQCHGKFVACSGCCNNVESEIVKKDRYHSCEELQNYFFIKNTNKVACDDDNKKPDGQVNYKTNTTRSENELISTCESTASRVVKEDTLIPMKQEMDCTACAAQGVPDLLKQCCDKALALQKTLAKPHDGVQTFLWASGCHNETIGEHDIPFQHTELYGALTQDQVNHEMASFIDDEYCSKSIQKSADTCPDPGKQLKCDTTATAATTDNPTTSTMQEATDFPTTSTVPEATGFPTSSTVPKTTATARRRRAPKTTQSGRRRVCRWLTASTSYLRILPWHLRTEYLEISDAEQKLKEDPFVRRRRPGTTSDNSTADAAVGLCSSLSVMLAAGTIVC